MNLNYGHSPEQQPSTKLPDRDIGPIRRLLRDRGGGGDRRSVVPWALRWLAPFVVLLAGYLAGRASAPPSRLVYVCSSVPCKSGQELTVFDKSGAPIWSVGEYGGAGVFGDNLKVYGPKTLAHPAVTISWESPLAYDRKFRLPSSCSGPALWIEPGGTWQCVADAWTLALP
jgi:hypothetical protein